MGGSSARRSYNSFGVNSRSVTARVLGAWIKGAVRRPVRALVVILTLLLMTVGMSGALVAGDMLDRLFVADAQAQWGEVDVEVTSGESGIFEESVARRIGTVAGTESSAWAPRLMLRSAVASGSSREPDASVWGLGAEEQSFAPLSAVQGTGDVLQLGPDKVMINERLSERLDVGVGAPLTMVLGVPEVWLDQPGTDTPLRLPAEAVVFTATISGVVADSGVADLGRTPNVLLRRDVLQNVIDFKGYVTHLHLAAEGDADDLIRTIGPQLRLDDLVAAPVAEDALEIADDEGGQFRSILLTLAVLVVAAATVAATQMLIGLAEDRSREIAVLRALGVPGRAIVRLVTAESLVYAVIAVAIGLILALPVAEFFAARLSDHFASLSAGRGREQVALRPVVDAGTLIAGVIVVAVAAALAGRSAGRRLAAVDVDELLRGPLVRLPQPPLTARRPIVVAMLGSLLLGAGLLGGDASDALRYIGLTLMLTAWWLHRRRLTNDRTRLDRRVAVLALVWATLGAGALADFSQGYETGFAILVVAGIVTTVAVTVLLLGRFRAVVGWIRAYAPRGHWQASLRTAGAYADAASGKSGRLVATFGIVLFVAVSLEVLGSATAIDVDRQSGGFDVVAESTVGMETLDVGEIEGLGAGAAVPSSTVPEDRFGTASPDDEDEDIVRLRYPVRMIAVTPAFVTTQQFRLADGAPRYESAAAALDAVMADRNKAVVDRYSRPPGAAIGDDVVIDLGLGPRRYELVGVLDTFLVGGVLVAPEEYIDLTASTGSTLLFGAAADDTTPKALAENVSVWGRGVGVNARTMEDVAADVVSANRTFTDTFALMLLLALIVTLVAVAAVLVRSARERRPYLGVLRAIGLQRGTVAAALAAEPITVALVGGVAGLLGGLVVLRLLFAVGFSDLAFVVDWARVLVVLGGLAVVLVILCTLSAWPLVPRDPSEALRELA
ncbi:MAG TPA: ABC transporter permease [Actinomycetota bacterium]|nr:ABC transporter permease [Actinomycetota bacterium]